MLDGAVVTRGTCMQRFSTPLCIAAYVCGCQDAGLCQRVAHLHEHDLKGRQADAVIVALPIRIDPAARGPPSSGYYRGTQQFKAAAR
jgi:hypothetical protein